MKAEPIQLFSQIHLANLELLIFFCYMTIF